MARALLLGGTGNISQHTTAALARDGWGVVVANRGRRAPERPLPEGVEVDVLDRADPAALGELLLRRRPDCLLDFVCFDPADAAALCARARAAGVAHVVFVSTVDVAGYPLRRLPHREEDAAGEPAGDYALRKRRCEEIVRAARVPGEFEVTVVRPTYCLGRSFVASFFHHQADAVVRRIREGRPVPVPGTGAERMHVSSAADAGRMCARLALQRQAFGGLFHVGSARGGCSREDYMRLLGEAVGRAPELVRVPEDVVERVAGGALRWGIWGLVFRHALEFSLEAFAREFPDFRWREDRLDGVRAFLERAGPEGWFDGPQPDDLEGRLLAACA